MWSLRLPLEFKTFGLLLAAGILLGNLLIVVLSLIPLFYVVLSFMEEGPSGFALSREKVRHSTWVDESISLESELSVRKGVGLVTVYQRLPGFFKLDQGSNFHVAFKGRREARIPLEYAVRCTRRGAYELGDTNVESFHFSGLEPSARVFLKGTRVDLLVRMRTTDIRRMRDPRLLSRIPMPLGAVTKLGSLTTDFKEIREYRHGDLYKSINWKATARRAMTSNPRPVVNDYEREGKRNVWLFVDSGRQMATGSSIENSFEYAIKAAAGLSDHYLARNCNVGLVLFNKGRVILPEAGRRQRALIDKTLIAAESTQMEGQMRSSIRTCRGHLAGSSPLVIVISMLTERNCATLKEGILEMRKLTGPRSQFMLVHISGNDIAASTPEEILSTAMLNMRTLPLIREVRSAGALVVPWNPRTQSMQKLMLAGIKRRR